MYLNRIYTLWEGQKPEYIKLCEKSMTLQLADDNIEHCQFLSIEKAKEYIPWHPRLDELKINLQVDWIKANAVYLTGGMWLDADMVVMKPLKDWMDNILAKHDFAGIPGVFMAHQGSEMLKVWIDGMREILDSKEEITFSSLIQPLLKQTGFREFEPITREEICPIYHTGDEFWRLFDKHEPVENYVKDNTHVFTLYNSAFDNYFKSLSTWEILKEDWLISKVFRKAIL